MRIRCSITLVTRSVLLPSVLICSIIPLILSIASDCCKFCSPPSYILYPRYNQIYTPLNSIVWFFIICVRDSGIISLRKRCFLAIPYRLPAISDSAHFDFPAVAAGTEQSQPLSLRIWNHLQICHWNRGADGINWRKSAEREHYYTDILVHLYPTSFH